MEPVPLVEPVLPPVAELPEPVVPVPLIPDVPLEYGPLVEPDVEPLGVALLEESPDDPLEPADG